MLNLIEPSISYLRTRRIMFYMLFILCTIALGAGCLAGVQSTRISPVLIRTSLLIIILLLAGNGSGVAAVAI